jgi:hypothetical protein
MADAATRSSREDDKQAITVKVSAPRPPDARSSTWSKHLTVAEATARAATAFGYMGDVSLTQHGANLDPSTQLVAAGGLA